MSANDKDNPPIGDDSLEQLLREARWPEESPPTLARLGRHWQTVWAVRRRRDIWLRRTAALAIAATLLAAATLGWIGLRPAEKPIAEKSIVNAGQSARPDSEKSATAGDRGPFVAKSPQPTPSIRHETRRPAAVERAVVDRVSPNGPRPNAPSDLAPWRPPNALEELMLAAHDRARRPASAIARRSPNKRSASDSPARLAGVVRGKSRNASKPLSPEKARVKEAIERLVSDKSADVAEAALDLRKSAAVSEQLLIETLDRGNQREQTAVLRLLAEIGGPLSVVPVFRAAHAPALRAPALATLARLADPSVLGELARSEQSPELQRSLLAALLARGEPDSMEVYLTLVANEATAESALAAARMLKDPPMDLLFSSLSEPLESRRIAAARVIGWIDGAATTQRLIAMVESGINRHEACIALLSSRGPEAMRYVDAAQRDPALAAILSGARLFTASENPPRS